MDGGCGIKRRWSSQIIKPCRLWLQMANLYDFTVFYFIFSTNSSQLFTAKHPNEVSACCSTDRGDLNPSGHRPPFSSADCLISLRLLFAGPH